MITKDKKTIAYMGLSISVITALAWAVISSLGLLGCGCATIPSQDASPIAHFRWLDQDWGICAAAQPLTAQEWLWLASQQAGQSGQGVGRVDHIIKLNDENRESDQMAVLSWGFSLDYSPISLMWQTNPMYHAELDTYIREVCHLIRPGTLCHCLRGADRTGCVVFQYRLNCGWPREAALVELRTNGFAGALLPGLDYFVEHARPHLGMTNTPAVWKANLKHQKP